jgi:AcrR family transcriptional regulator
MARRRRSPEEARTEILDAAERLLRTQGPDGVRISKVAAEAGMSHPGLLHHFGSAEHLAEALHERLSRQIREDLLGLLAGGTDRAAAFEQAAAALADPVKGRLLAWVVARGGDPFPPAQERGLGSIAASLEGGDADRRYKVLLVVLAMFGESLVGESVRARLGLTENPADFRRWLIASLRDR